MDLKRYEKTRYQNIYRNKKNKNYMIMLSNPKTTIGIVNGKKIFDIEEAKKIRDNPRIKLQKHVEIKTKNNFDELWEDYINDCKYLKKQAYSTYHKKEKIYNKYFKNQFEKSITKITKDIITKFINGIDTTNKQKNEILKQLRAFFNWCVDNELLLLSPVAKIKDYKVIKSKMKYWNPDELQKFFDTIDSVDNETAYRIKIFTILGFALGDRVGETRAIPFGNIDTINNKIYLGNSIDYDPNNETHIKVPKTKDSTREIDVSPLIIKKITDYKQYLQKKGYIINDDTLIFVNHSTNKPYTDSALRKQFYKFCDLAGVQKIRMYDLRHTYVATMMSEGLPLYLISERLGHKNYSTTVNKYGHLSNEVRKEVALTTDKYL